MSDLNIASTQSTPSVVASAEQGSLVMRGDSYPENSFEFFVPIVEWIENQLNHASALLCIELHLLYLNTSSVKAMMDIFDMLEEAHVGGRAVCVKWLYDKDNARVADLAAEFKEDCSFDFDIIGQ